MTEQKVQAIKQKMTQVFEEDGTVVPVTIVRVQDDQVNWGDFQQGQDVVVTGISKGKGFAGAVKRYSFAGGPKTHGQSDRHRAVGSIGAGTTPGKVLKGKKMPGRMGGEQKTVKGLRLVRIFPEDQLMYISGAVPGGPKSQVTITVHTDTVSTAED